MKLRTVGVTIYAAGMLALGFLCIVNKDIIIGRPPAGILTDLNPFMGYVGGAVVMIAAFAILIHKKELFASIIIALLILSLSVTRHLPYFRIDRLNGFKAFAFAGGSLIIACSFLENNKGRLLNNKKMIKAILFISTLLLAAFLIAAGYAHIKYADFVKAFIPSYIPFHGFFTYFCAVCLFAGGVGLMIPVARKQSALLTGIMLSGWFLLLHIPRFIANMNDASDRMGLCESFAFAGIFFCLAGMRSKEPRRLW